jgi:hypothetical protein
MTRDQITVPLPVGWGTIVSQEAANLGMTTSEFVRAAIASSLDVDMPVMKKAGRPMRRMRQGQSVDWAKP